MLQQTPPPARPPPPMQTGMEVDHIVYNGREYGVREVGSPMMSMWPSYYAACSMVVVRVRLCAALC